MVAKTHEILEIFILGCETIYIYIYNIKVQINIDNFELPKKLRKEPLKACCRQKMFCILRCKNCVLLFEYI